MKEKTFTVGEDNDEHTIGAAECSSCWTGYPILCGFDCPGLIHASFGDENYDGDYWLSTKCDVCGLPE
jgi:hypothetical protein